MRTWILKEFRGGVASIKKAFTLVEMLIVVVIIGILAAAILPRITGYLAKTRDMKRQVDLRNIAAAIERYKDEKGEFLTRGILGWTESTWGTFQASALFPCGTLEGFLGDYITAVPRDPSAENLVQLHKFAVQNYPNYRYGKYELGTTFAGCKGKQVIRGRQGVAGQPGQYFYQVFKKGGINMGAAIVAAKVETAELANYVRFKDQETLEGGYFKPNQRKQIAGGWDQEIMHDIGELQLCTLVEKVKKGEESFQIQSDGQVMCKYSSQDQLYYIVKIE